ncbi:MAG TPA: ATP-binding protein, partial [Croceibacterium sp.]|nr:ATP-binding protein [Croceibacterium sp.]
VCRIFKPSGQQKGVEIRLSGNSYQKSLGPEIFEIVPYVLLDNGIKYAPDRSKIEVDVRDVGSEVVLTVASYGPLIKPNELGAIFEKGFRGESAQAVSSGSGIGLYLMREIVVKHFGGSVAAEQSGGDRLHLDGRTYYLTSFSVVLPSIVS